MRTFLTSAALLLAGLCPASAELSVSEYRKAVDAMDAKAGAFATGLTENRPGTEERREDLLEALGAYQEVVIKGVDSENPALAKAAEDSIAEVTAWAEVIQRTDGVLRMRSFWEHGSDVLMSRLVLEEALESGPSS